MRNLKKVLSLALAMVMLLGMMVIGAGAVETSFTDNGKIGEDYKEAVAVMSAIGVLNGKDAAGNFDPQGTLTRAEAATILVRMTMGNDAAAGLANVTKSGVFTDMSNHWAAGYVDACFNMGIVGGIGNSLYAPDSTLTGTQFAAMLLRAVGVEGEFVGPAWESAVIAAANQNSLSEVTTGNISRESAAKMGFDGLQYSPSGEKTYKVGDLSFDNAMDAIIAANGDMESIQISTASDSLATKVFKLDIADNSTDAFGRATKVWQIDGKDAVTVESATPVVTYTTASTSVATDLKGYKYTDNLKATVNGAVDDTQAAASAANIQTLTGNGKLVEVYANSNKVVNKVIVVTYRVGALGVAETRTRTTYSVAGLSGIDYVDEDTADTVVFHGEAEKDDIVTAVKTGSTLHIYPTTQVEGEMSSVTASAVTVNGERYTVGTTLGDGVDNVAMTDFDGFLGADNVVLYVDVNGVAVYAKADTVAPTDYCYIASLGATVTSSPDGTDANVQARVVLADGTVGVYRLATKPLTASKDVIVVGTAATDAASVKVIPSPDAGSNWGTTINASNLGSIAGNVYLYSIDDDVMTLKYVAADSTVANGTTVIGTVTGYQKETSKATSNSKTALFNESTVFVEYNETAKTASVIEGRSKLGSAANFGAKVVMTGTSTANTAVAKVVFVTSGTAGVADNGDYAYVDYTKYEQRRINNVVTRVYTGTTPDGETVELTFPASTADGTVDAKTLYAYNVDNVITGKYTTRVHTGTATVTADGDLLEVSDNAGTYYAIADDTQTIYIDENGSQINGNEVIAVLDSSNQVVVVFVTNADAEKGAAASVSVADKSVAAGKSTTLTATYSAGDSGLTVSSYAWSSSSTANATVTGTTATGTVNGVAQGTATITVTATLSDGSTVSDTCTVTVTAAQTFTPTDNPTGATINERTGAIAVDYVHGTDVTEAVEDALVAEGWTVNRWDAGNDKVVASKGAITNQEFTWRGAATEYFTVKVDNTTYYVTEEGYTKDAPSTEFKLDMSKTTGRTGTGYLNGKATPDYVAYAADGTDGNKVAVRTLVMGSGTNITRNAEVKTGYVTVTVTSAMDKTGASTGTANGAVLTAAKKSDEVAYVKADTAVDYNVTITVGTANTDDALNIVATAPSAATVTPNTMAVTNSGSSVNVKVSLTAAHTANDVTITLKVTD